MGFNAGKFGKEIESWSDEEIIADAMKTLRQIYGNSIPQPIDYQLTRWSQDPFTFGSYSYYATNSTPNHRQELAKPINKKVFFSQGKPLLSIIRLLYMVLILVDCV